MIDARKQGPPARAYRLALLASTFFIAATMHAENLYIDYSPKPRLSRLTQPTLCLLDPHSKADLKTNHERGHRLLAYISLVELAKGSPADLAAQKRGVPFIGTNPDWNSHLLDIQHAAWETFVLDDCAAPALGKGYDGLFFDTLDSAEHIAGPDAERLKDCRDRIANLVRAAHQRWPDRPIIVNRGFALLPELKAILSGVLVESVYQSFDPATRRYRPVRPTDSQWLETRVREAQALKLPVYAVDYVHPTEKRLGRATAERLKKLGCTPFVTTHALTGEIVAPEP